jgi:hypothetical protein
MTQLIFEKRLKTRLESIAERSFFGYLPVQAQSEQVNHRERNINQGEDGHKL